MAKLTKSQKKKAAIIITCTVLVVATGVVVTAVLLPPAAPPVAVAGVLFGAMIAGEIIKLGIEEGEKSFVKKFFSSKKRKHHHCHETHETKLKRHHEVFFNSYVITHYYNQSNRDGDYINPQLALDSSDESAVGVNKTVRPHN